MSSFMNTDEFLSGHPTKFIFPLDILLLIVRDLEPKDILSLNQCSKALAFLTNSRAVWHTVLHAYLIASHIPIPPLPPLRALSSLSDAELKSLVRRAFLLRRNWTSARPTRTRDIAQSPVFAHCTPAGLSLVPGRGSRYAVFLFTARGPLSTLASWAGPKHLLQCIDVGTSGAPAAAPVTVASRSFTHPVYFAVNGVREGPVMLAAASTERGVMTTYILGLAPRASEHINSAHAHHIADFVTLAEYPTKGIPMLLSGDILAVGDQEGNVWLHDTMTGKMLYELRDPHAPHINETVCVVLLRDTVVTIGPSTIKLFNLPTPLSSPPSSPAVPHPDAMMTSPPSSSTHTIVLPAVEHRWRWRIDSIRAYPQIHDYAPSSAFSDKGHYPPINIFIRFGSWYPWPINMLYHFVLAPSSAAPTQTPNLTLIEPPLVPSLDLAHEHPHLHPGTTTTSTESISYAFPPVILRYTHSPIELFAVVDTAVGPYGTALFTDSLSDLDTGPVAMGREEWQRVAGTMLYRGDDRRQADAGGSGVPQVETTMVFGELPRPGATLIAMDEETGRIAIAWKDGSISFWDYMPDE